MAAADDDIEKLLREVDGALGSAGSGGRVQPAGSARPATAGVSGPPPSRAAALPRATAVAAVWGVGVGGVFLVVPFMQSFSGAVGAFVAAFSVSFLGRRRR